MPDDIRELGPLEEIADVIGRQKAIRLATNLGGQTVHVPLSRNLLQTHPLVQALGSETVAQRLSDAYGGEQLYIPMARSVVARTLMEQGLTTGQIAKKLNCSRRSARRYMSARGTMVP